jgi:hypothetical protein
MAFAEGIAASNSVESSNRIVVSNIAMFLGFGFRLLIGVFVIFQFLQFLWIALSLT